MDTGTKGTHHPLDPRFDTEGTHHPLDPRFDTEGAPHPLDPRFDTEGAPHPLDPRFDTEGAPPHSMDTATEGTLPFAQVCAIKATAHPLRTHAQSITAPLGVLLPPV